jgi:hypothetical protein
MASRQESEDEITCEALQSIGSMERAIWEGSIRRNIRNQHSRFYSLQPKYGIDGSTKLIVAQLWLLPAVTFLIIAVALNLMSTGQQLTRDLSYVSLGLFFCCVFLMAFRALIAAVASRRKTRTH